jgi:dihydroorotase
MVQSGLLDWAGVADRLSIAPARIAGYEQHGQNIAAGMPAHLTVINPTINWIVDRDLVLSKSRNTPYHGYELPGLVTHTFFGGKLVLNGAQVVDKVAM